MKLSFLHYYFKERNRRNPARYVYDVRGLLNAYVAYPDNTWKGRIQGEDGENLLLLQSQRAGVYMLIGTRRQDIIKAINTNVMSCADLAERLQADETAGFAAYFKVDASKLSIAGTLRGPRAAALERFINLLLTRLGAAAWKFCMQSLSTSITLEQARAMAFVSRADIKVTPGNPLFQRLKDLCAVDNEVAAFNIIITGKKAKNLKSVVLRLGREAGAENLDKFTVRARAAADDALTDYFMTGDGKLTDDIEPGTENHILGEIHQKFLHNQQAHAALEKILNEHVYDNGQVPVLDRLGNADHWRDYLEIQPVDPA